MSPPRELLFSSRRKLPIYLATEVSECGLACLAMISNYHGHDVDMNGVRQLASVSISGMNMRVLMQLGDDLGMSCRALRVDLSALHKVALPAILHWDLNHFVVLKSLSRGKAIVHDPSCGRRILSIDELSNHFTGAVLELSPSSEFEPIRARVRIRASDLWSNIKGLHRSIALMVSLSVALQIVAFVAPFQMQLVVDQAIGRQDADILVIICLAFGIVALLNAAITAIRDWTVQLFGSQFVFQVTSNVFRHLLRLPADYFEKRHIGDILARIGSLRTIQDAVTKGVISSTIDGLMALCAIIILFFYSVGIGWIVLGSILVLATLTLGTFPLIRTQTERSIVAMANEQTHLMESIRAALMIKLAGIEAARHSIWRNLYSKSFNAGVGVQRTQIVVSFLQSTVLGLQAVAVVYLGAANTLKGGGISIGMLYALLTFRAVASDRSLSLMNQGNQLRMLGLYFDRLGDIIGHTPEISLEEPSVALPHRRDIALRDVSYRYGAADPLILTGVGLEIDDGDFVAIVGPTGSGKTTLLKLVLGLHRPTEGQILLGGQVATPQLWRRWRTLIGLVRQDDELLSGTLIDNITLFDPDMNLQRVQEVAMRASIHDDIMHMPMGYRTLIGDMGSSLSGGQRQRVLLARALYRDPKILMLDEGTANLDPETEARIAEMIERLPITRIIVAHRPALVNAAKKVIRIEGTRLERIR